MKQRNDGRLDSFLYIGDIGIVEDKMETTLVYGVYIGIMEKTMETTTADSGYIGMMEKWKLP